MSGQDYEVRTDLAVEAKEMYVEKGKQKKGQIKGVEISEKQEGNIRISFVNVDREGSEQIGKSPGSYRTIYSDAIKRQDTSLQHETAKAVCNQLIELLDKNQVKKDATGLIVGLGNRHVTPDALGPLAIEKVLVTNHLFVHQPEYVAEGYRRVATINPGVMGVTGIETSDIIKGVIEKLKPDFVIAIDALASRSIERVNATIQLSDAGIHPGSGVGNKRKELSKETLGLPVIAIGVPTVVDAVTITSDAIDYVLKHIGKEMKEVDKPSKSLTPAGMNFGTRKLSNEDLPSPEKREKIFGMIGSLDEQEKRALMQEVLTPLGHNLMVTPKEIDGYIEDMAHLLAKGINAALHENVKVEEASSYSR
ncbi:GPR endopeptidase . Aspartic peptidase. MEROPS family A25 [Gracilibacillus ureilyticus]|uniref:Germination protease n=1 Tax=Gracilibacillus ureilyticus TaxID=531814 RepID=A0A1H9M4A7_9BACI|nr:GPR endopeptidase [Gracilibacillus ureilyticus]SER18337.1 GPR endopeptidase . Aspartic peptidase. MEROPS family A25 [Gracilibacillus ureilyticus]